MWSRVRWHPVPPRPYLRWWMKLNSCYKRICMFRVYEKGSSQLFSFIHQRRYGRGATGCCMLVQLVQLSRHSYVQLFSCTTEPRTRNSKLLICISYILYSILYVYIPGCFDAAKYSNTKSSSSGSRTLYKYIAGVYNTHHISNIISDISGPKSTRLWKHTAPNKSRGEKKTAHRIKKRAHAGDRTTNWRCSWSKSWLFRFIEPATIFAIRHTRTNSSKQQAAAAAATAAVVQQHTARAAVAAAAALFTYEYISRTHSWRRFSFCCKLRNTYICRTAQLLRAPSVGKHNSARVDEGRKSWNLLAIKMQGTNRSG